MESPALHTGGIRRPAAAGQFYPKDPCELRETVDVYLKHAEIPNLKDVRAVIAPHAGYACSGAIAAHSFRLIRGPDTPRRTVYLAGPAHYAPVDSIGLSTADFFETPLGKVEVDRAETRRLLDIGGPFVPADEAHEADHCLEVELPFLQVVLDSFKIVPLLFGGTRHRGPAADVLSKRFAEDDAALLVVSSDLSHFEPYEDAQRVDARTIECIFAGDTAGMEHAEACGRGAIALLMEIAGILSWQPHLLAYANSGDTCGNRDRVVGYASVAYTALSQ